jgi:hypothetical protein
MPEITIDIDLDALDENDIKEYVVTWYNVDDIFAAEKIIEYVEEYFAPEDVYKEEELKEWALENGFKEE